MFPLRSKDCIEVGKDRADEGREHSQQRKQYIRRFPAGVRHGIFKGKREPATEELGAKS